MGDKVISLCAARGGLIDETLPSGVKVKLRRLTAPIWEASREASRGRAVASALAAINGEDHPDAWPEGLDPENEAHRIGFGLTILNGELAALSIVEWEGVEESVSPENARLLVSTYPLDGDTIQRALIRTNPLVGADEGNG